MAWPVQPAAIAQLQEVHPGGNPQYQPVLDAAGQPVRLGEGAYGVVYHYKDVNNKNADVAVKKIALIGLRPQDAQLLERFLPRELENHYLLNHPHVVKLKDVFLTGSHLNLVLEMADRGMLYDYVNQHIHKASNKEADARWFLQQLVLTMDYFHRRGVAHRDIKLENTLLKHVPGKPRPIIKVADFGLSKHNAALTYTRVGTLTYMSPEVFLAKRPDGTGVGLGYNGKKADIWSTGVILYAMLCGRYPFDETLPPERFLGEMTRRPLLQLPAHLSPDCKQLLEGLLHPNPDERITVDAIKQHPWFLQDLPPKALQMNDSYINAGPACKLTQAELQAVIAQVITRLQPVGQAAAD